MTSAVVLNWLVGLGVGAVLAEVARSVLQRRKMGADAAKVITDAATVLLLPLQERIRELEALLGRTREELRLATGELSEARHELEALRVQMLHNQPPRDNPGK